MRKGEPILLSLAPSEDGQSITSAERKAMQERAERVRERVELGRSRSSEQIGSVIPFEEIDE